MNAIRIGTRTSPLARWQANAVKDAFLKNGFGATCIGIESSGDVDLTTPLYAMGISGIFTKELDTALLNNNIDVAVHSLKDVPSQLASGLILAAVLPRGSAEDVIVTKPSVDLNKERIVIATSSIRRKSQWLERYPTHQIIPIRGNVQTRLHKLETDPDLAGMIFAKAGLERLGLLNANAITLDWMLPAPAQGIIGVVCRSDDSVVRRICKQINDTQSLIAAEIEREFMYSLQAGCSVPISCVTSFEKDAIVIKAGIHNLTGTKSYKYEKKITYNEVSGVGRSLAMELLNLPGASLLMEEIRTV